MPQNRFMPSWQQNQIQDSNNRCNSDVDLVSFRNHTVLTYSWGDQLNMQYNHVAMARWRGGGWESFVQSFFPKPTLK